MTITCEQCGETAPESPDYPGTCRWESCEREAAADEEAPQMALTYHDKLRITHKDHNIAFPIIDGTYLVVEELEWRDGIKAKHLISGTVVWFSKRRDNPTIKQYTYDQLFPTLPAGFTWEMVAERRAKWGHKPITSPLAVAGGAALWGVPLPD